MHLKQNYRDLKQFSLFFLSTMLYVKKLCFVLRRMQTLLQCWFFSISPNKRIRVAKCTDGRKEKYIQYWFYRILHSFPSLNKISKFFKILSQNEVLFEIELLWLIGRKSLSGVCIVLFLLGHCGEKSGCVQSRQQ